MLKERKRVKDLSADVPAKHDPAITMPERVLIVILRIIGVCGLFAIPAIFLPYSWMNAIHGWLGLGTLPDVPIVGYLARSLSAFYAAVSAMILFVSFDIRHYRGFIGLWAGTIAVMGSVFLGIGIVEGLPASWTWGEGPPTIATGLLVIWLQRNIPD